MCGRFTLRTPSRDLVEIFQLLRSLDISPRYNIAPTQPVLAIRQVGKFREPCLLKWGLVPSWAKDPRSGPPLINARAETLAAKPAFRSAFGKRRCLIPADGFYEWKKGEEKTRQAFYIRMLKDRPFAFAGLWESWKGGESSAIVSCTIITTTANSRLAELHERMPVLLHEEDYDRWLNPTLDDPALLQGLLVPYPAEEMTFYPVSPFVNSPRNDGPNCVEAWPAENGTSQTSQ
jgi:putative SOS response-associated peptidase YedK